MLGNEAVESEKPVSDSDLPEFVRTRCNTTGAHYRTTHVSRNAHPVTRIAVPLPVMSIGLGRPTFHVVAQRGWMNDPCAPGYDPSTGLYHLMYQWNPHSHTWEDISWGDMTSADLVSWKYSSSEPMITPSAQHNEKGIFTGTMVPTGLYGSPGLSIFYTSATHLPIGWTIPHKRGAEGVSLLTSSDGGERWVRYADGPVLLAEPDHLDVTGFRDPAIIEWPVLGKRLGSEKLAVLSGGLQGEIEGPRMFLFELDPVDLTKWRFLKTLGSFERNYRVDQRWSGDFGSNWECGTFISLRHESSGLDRTVGIVGVEGGNLRPHAKAYRASNPGRGQRGQRYCNWFFANLTDDNDFDFTTTGMMDWADWYAPSVFTHPDGRKIAWGWIVEEDLGDVLAKEKGWIGCLGVPRELRLKVYEGVIGTSRTPLAQITSLELDLNRVLTLDIRPLRELEKLRLERVHHSESVPSGTLLGQAPDSYEMYVRADMGVEGTISISIRESSDVKTTIKFNMTNEELVVHRDRSSRNTTICLQDEVAALTLFRYTAHREPLELSIFVDKDVVEIFANGRATISTRIYAPADAGGISLYIDGETTVTEATVWAMGSIGLQGGSNT